LRPQVRVGYTHAGATSVRDGWDMERIEDGVSVRGEIDLATAGDLAEALYDAAATTDTGFLIDLSQVTFIDSTGIDALTRVLNVHADKRFVIVPSNQVFTLLHLSGLTNRAWPNVDVRSPAEDRP
jgi:anti-anti-sigma factor